MKGKVLKTDEGWYVEIPSDLHTFQYGWGDNSIYPLIVEDVDVWVGKEVEVEVVGYDENTFVPSMLKVVKPKKVMREKIKNILIDYGYGDDVNTVEIDKTDLDAIAEKIEGLFKETTTKED
jgi:hypothetical protein